MIYHACFYSTFNDVYLMRFLYAQKGSIQLEYTILDCVYFDSIENLNDKHFGIRLSMIELIYK